MLDRKNAAVAVLLFIVSNLPAFAGTIYCSAHDFTQAYGIAPWSGVNKHANGSHFTSYFPEDRCTYDDPYGEINGTICNTNQLGDFVFMPFGSGTGDNGTVQGAGVYHQIENDSQTYQAFRAGAATPPATYWSGTAIDECRVNLGCPSFTISVAGVVTTTGGGIIQTSQAHGFNSPGCPVRRFHTGGGGCTCRACGCGSPLMMDASGLGGKFGTFDGGGAQFYQFTGFSDGILFKLKMMNGSWKRTKRQRIAWTKPGGTMVVLVLPNDNGTITNGDNLFGNVTHCGDKLCANGFEALRYKCDDPINGGNNDGFCDKKDALWDKLRWLSGRPGDPKAKLYRMEQLGVQNIAVALGTYYEVEPEDAFKDEHGNHARLRGVADMGWKDYGEHGKVHNNRLVWDVWLLDDIRKDEDAEWHSDKH